MPPLNETSTLETVAVMPGMVSVAARPVPCTAIHRRPSDDAAGAIAAISSVPFVIVSPKPLTPACSVSPPPSDRLNESSVAPVRKVVLPSWTSTVCRANETCAEPLRIPKTLRSLRSPSAESCGPDSGPSGFPGTVAQAIGVAPPLASFTEMERFETVAVTDGSTSDALIPELLRPNQRFESVAEASSPMVSVPEVICAPIDVVPTASWRFESATVSSVAPVRPTLGTSTVLCVITKWAEPPRRPATSTDASPETTSEVSPVNAIVCVTPFASRTATPPVCTFVQSSGEAPPAAVLEPTCSELTASVSPGTPVSEAALRSAWTPSHERPSGVEGVSDAIARPPPFTWKPMPLQPTKRLVAVSASVVSDALDSPVTPPMFVPVTVCVVSAKPTVPLMIEASEIVAVPVTRSDVVPVKAIDTVPPPPIGTESWSLWPGLSVGFSPKTPSPSRSRLFVQFSACVATAAVLVGSV